MARMTPDLEEMVIEALACNMTHVEAAAQVGVSSKTVQRLLASVDFMGRLAQRRAMKVIDYAGRLDDIEDLALATLREAMGAGERMADRLHAVDCWSRQRIHVRTALDIEARFLALEARDPVNADAEAPDDAEGGAS